jgi:bacteriocin-like protein
MNTDRELTINELNAVSGGADKLTTLLSDMPTTKVTVQTQNLLSDMTTSNQMLWNLLQSFRR